MDDFNCFTDDSLIGKTMETALELVEESEACDNVPTIGLTEALILLLIQDVDDIESAICGRLG